MGGFKSKRVLLLIWMNLHKPVRAKPGHRFVLYLTKLWKNNDIDALCSTWFTAKWILQLITTLEIQKMKEVVSLLINSGWLVTL